MKIESEKLLYQECEKLNRLVDEAIQRGTPIGETYEIREQFRKVRVLSEALQNEAVLAQSFQVDKLVVMAEGEKEKEG